MAKSRALAVISKVDVEMSLTSMIDVTFLLLIFFMVTSKFKSSEGKVQAFLPKDKGLGTSSPKAVTETRIKILWYEKGANRPTKAKEGRAVIKIGNRIFPSVFYREDPAESPDFESLREYMAEAKADYKSPDGDASKTIPVIIDARTPVPWKYVVRTLNTCLEAGVTNVTFAAAENPYE